MNRLKTKKTFILKLTALFIIAALLVMLSLSAGITYISPSGIISAITGTAGSENIALILNLRFMRILLALAVGASLAVSGTLFQSLLKNPLADPFIIGVSSGAALGVTIAVISSMSSSLIILFSFIGSLSTILIIYLLSRNMKFGTSSIILAGISLSFIFSAAILLIYSLSKAEDVHKAVMWLMGDLSIARYGMLFETTAISCLLIAVSLIFHRHLDIISFGHDFSKTTGVSRFNLTAIFWTASLLSAVSVSICGAIGFIGLIIPHVVRLIFGPGHIRLIPLSAVCGALFLMISDTIARSIIPPYEIPVGIITNFAGGIFFLIFIFTKKGIA